MYKVVVGFMDDKDNNHVYRKGNKYPRRGYRPEAERIEYLLGSANRLGRPVIGIAPARKKTVKKG